MTHHEIREIANFIENYSKVNANAITADQVISQLRWNTPSNLITLEENKILQAAQDVLRNIMDRTSSTQAVYNLELKHSALCND